ncbi:MAG: hypothetical protein SVG88_07920 [Halobacteriales archaeon]|nr:hypothetical protein [Halobacteriales archaeon]
MTDEGSHDELRALNRRAVALLILSTLVAILSLFLLPVLRQRGLSFGAAFWILSGLEFLAVIGVAFAVTSLFGSKPVEAGKRS